MLITVPLALINKVKLPLMLRQYLQYLLTHAQGLRLKNYSTHARGLCLKNYSTLTWGLRLQNYSNHAQGLPIRVFFLINTD
jgi:hypothetical protein